MKQEEMKKMVREKLEGYKDFPKNSRSCKILEDVVNNLLYTFFKEHNQIFFDPYMPNAVVSKVKIKTDGKHFSMQPVFSF